MENTFGTEKAKTPQPPLFVGVINRLESLVERQLKLSQNIYGKTIRLGEVDNVCVGDDPEKVTPSRETVVGEIIFLMNDLEKGIELLETSLDNLERIV
jgi:hypothetical protein